MDYSTKGLLPRPSGTSAAAFGSACSVNTSVRIQEQLDFCSSRILTHRHTGSQVPTTPYVPHPTREFVYVHTPTLRHQKGSLWDSGTPAVGRIEVSSSAAPTLPLYDKSQRGSKSKNIVLQNSNAP